MRNIRSTLSRFKLLNSVLVLALMWGALAIPRAVRAETCDNVCSGWGAKTGCVNCNWCCVADDGKSYRCTPKVDSDCGTGGPLPVTNES